MNQPPELKNIQRIVHLVIVLGLTISSIGLISLTIAWRWEYFALPLFSFTTILAWWFHISNTIPEKARVILYDSFLMVGIFFFGIHPGTFYDVGLIITFSLFLFSLTNEKIAVTIILGFYITYLLYTFLLYLAGTNLITPLVPVRIIASIVIVVLTYCLARLQIQKHEDEKKNYYKMIDQLSDVNRRTEDFLTNVSHELRTPINAVTGITAVMLQAEDDPEKQRDLLSIQKAGDRLMGQIGDILDYTEIDTDRFILSEEEYQFSSVVNDIVTEMRILEQERGLELIFDLDANVPTLLVGDGRRIKKLIRHILDNSIKYTKNGGIYTRITSVPKDYGINLIITIKDTGIGIPKEDLVRIIHGFYQTDSSKSRRVGGIGLGLPIVYGIVKAMGGFVQMESRENEGTTVRMSIPQKVADHQPSLTVVPQEDLCLVCYLRSEKYSPEVRDFYNDLIEHTVEGLNLTLHRTNSFEGLKHMVSMYRVTHIFTAKEEYEENSAYFESLKGDIKTTVISDDSLIIRPGSHIMLARKPVFSLALANIVNAAESEERLALEGRKLVFPGVKALVVDDEEMNLFVANGIFKSYLMEVTTVLSGMEAIKACEQNDYELVFLDHMMPEMDGVETLKLLKKEYEGRTQPVFIALTANAVSGAREMFLSEGFDEFIAKPVESLELERMLRKVLPSHFIRYALTELDEDAFIRAAKEQMAGNKVDPVLLLAAQGLNTSEGIDYCRGDRAFYAELLLKFNQSAKKKISELSDDFERKDWEDYRIRAHALKSSAKMVGADELSALALAAENAAKEKDIEKLESGFEELVLTYQNMADMIGEALDTHVEIVEGSYPEIETEDYVNQLNAILTCLHTFEEEQATKILTGLFQYSHKGTPIKEMLSDAKELIEDFEMNRAAEILRTVLSEIEEGGE